MVIPLDLVHGVKVELVLYNSIPSESTAEKASFERLCHKISFRGVN